MPPYSSEKQDPKYTQEAIRPVPRAVTRAAARLEDNKMKHNISRRVCLMTVLAVLTTGTAAFADITASQFRLPYWPTMKNAAAFDKVNQVYLVTLNGHPVSGQFLDKNGATIGGIFQIASAGEGAFVSWSQIAFGGPSTDPAFLVTYIVQNGSSYVKYGRLVRYRGGAAVVGPPSGLTDTNGQWQAQEKAQSVWLNDHFVVATRVVIGALPQPIVQRFEMNGSVSGPVSLGDSNDFEGSPTLACAPTGVCLATGFAGGYPFGTGGAVFARLFDGNTLALLSGLFYLDDHSSRMDDPSVVFNSVTGQFVTAWWQASYAQFRTVATSGAPGPYGPVFGPWAGDIALRFNAATGTTLLVTKWANPATPPERWADLYAVEVDSSFQMSPVTVAQWDGSWPDYWSSIAADEVNGRWLVTSFELAGGRGALVQGAGGVSTPPPSRSVSRAALHDLNGDGFSDLLWQHDDGWMAAWYMQGNAVVGFGLLSINRVPMNWKVAGAGDLNGDGAADVVWRDDQGYLAVWYMQGQTVIGIKMLSVPRMAELNWTIRAVGDVNGDGKADLIWEHETLHAVTVWLMDGHTLVQSLPLNVWTTAPGWKVMGAGDINGDGMADIIWQKPGTNGLAAWLLQGNIVVGQLYRADLAAPGSDWTIGGVGDINRDGCADLVWQNVVTGQVSVWYLQGWNVIAWNFLPTVDPRWKLRGPG